MNVRRDILCDVRSDILSDVTSNMTSDVNVDKDVIKGTVTDVALLFSSAVCAQVLCVPRLK